MSVIEFISEDRINQAWDAYAYRARLVGDDPKLLADRRFNEELARLHERWRRLYLRRLRTLESA